MSIIKLVMISFGLAMDAFAVAVCKGLSMKKMNYSKALIVGLYFGIFQALMPFIGYLLGSRFEDKITSIDHWIALILLSIIGIGMIKESFSKEDEIDDKTDFKTMFVLAIATSIDALAIGITFAFLKVNLFLSVSLIGIITFILSIIGVIIGHFFGSKYGSKAEFIGGVILIIIGFNILFEHLDIILL